MVYISNSPMAAGRLVYFHHLYAQNISLPCLHSGCPLTKTTESDLFLLVQILQAVAVFVCICHSSQSFSVTDPKFTS